MISRRGRRRFRPMLDTLPTRLTPGTYPAIAPMPADPMGTDTPIWNTPVPILIQPNSPDTSGGLTDIQLHLNSQIPAPTCNTIYVQPCTPASVTPTVG